ncbi:Kelch-like protein 10 [Labeo rohita]|uniref:Kelch-like protein 10 n=1 Tax=Labeo rohita TaxID=84645 RepID=A0ABQ8LRZ4_LABRO|nr:Kelch-like protein 10 [Labeo rohita]
MDSDAPTSSDNVRSEILLAIGGWSCDCPTKIIEAYDSNADSWVRLPLQDEHPRAYHGTAVLNEDVYCVGGFDGVQYFNSVRKLNLTTQTWHEVGPMYERRCYVSVAVLDGLIYAMGGCDGYERLNSVERYKPETNQWTRTAPMIERRSDASATSLQGRIYICGGYTGRECLFSAESFHPETNQWTLIAPMRSRRVGGYDGSAGGSRLWSAEAYNPQRNIWCDIASMHSPRSNFGIGVVDHQLFAVGGYVGFIQTSDVERYNERTNEW